MRPPAPDSVSNGRFPIGSTREFSRRAQQNLYATNFRLHGASTKLALRNTGTEDIVATPRFRPVKGDPNDFIDLGGISLKPDETKSVDLDSLSRGTYGRSDFDTVSVDILNTGSKGSLIGALSGVDENNGLTYDVPLRDSGGPRNLSGAYPWRLDGDVSTIVAITNVTALDAQFVVQINFPGGPYLLDPQKLPAGNTAIFDLRQIRDRQLPDRNGHTIPRSVKGGQFRWYIRSGGHLIGRAEMLSVSRGISSSYSCGNPCPPHYDYGYIDPDPTDVPVGDSEAHNVLEIDVDSYSNQYGPYSATVTAASSSDTNIATFDGSSVTGVSMGDVGTTATVEYPLYWWEQGTYDCTLYGTQEDYVYGSAESKAEVHISNVTSAVTLSARDNGTGTVTVHVGAGPGIPNNVDVTVELILDSKNPETIQNAAPPGSKSVAVKTNSPGNANFTVGTIGGNSVTGTLTYKAYITAVSSENVTFNPASQGSCLVTVP